MSIQNPALGELSGKVALVTGAASGIGAATALALAARGAHVVCADIQSAAATLSQLRDGGGDGSEVRFDLARRDSVAQAVAQAARTAASMCRPAMKYRSSIASA